MKIQRTFSITAAALLVAAGSAAAQSKLSVKTGDSFNYDSKITIEQTISMAGTETVNHGAIDGNQSLHVNNAAKSQIDWTLDGGKQHLSMENQMIPGGKIDTMLNAPATQFSTDLKGKITKQAADQQSVMANLLGNAYGNVFNSWISPTIARSVKPGESWDEKHNDSIVNGMVGVVVHTTSSIRYTYDGIVDTLGAKCMRVRARITSMTMEGSGSFGGTKVSLDGDGTSSNDFYYAVSDGLLKASALDMQTNIRMVVDGAGDMVVPIAQRITGTLLRK